MLSTTYITKMENTTCITVTTILLLNCILTLSFLIIRPEITGCKTINYDLCEFLTLRIKSVEHKDKM